MDSGATATSRSWTATPEIVKPPAVLDQEAAAELKTRLVRLVAEHKKLIIVDMSNVTHVDVLPLAVIGHMYRMAKEARLRLAVAGLDGQPLALFGEWPSDPPVPAFKSVDAAVTQLAAV